MRRLLFLLISYFHHSITHCIIFCLVKNAMVEDNRQSIGVRTERLPKNLGLTINPSTVNTRRMPRPQKDLNRLSIEKRIPQGWIWIRENYLCFVAPICWDNITIIFNHAIILFYIKSSYHKNC